MSDALENCCERYRRLPVRLAVRRVRRWLRATARSLDLDPLLANLAADGLVLLDLPYAQPYPLDRYRLLRDARAGLVQDDLLLALGDVTGDVIVLADWNPLDYVLFMEDADGPPHRLGVDEFP